MNKDFNIRGFIKKYYKLNRAWVCDETLFFTNEIKEIFGEGEVIKAKSGEECLTWIIPPAWNVKKGVLKDSSGKVIVNFKDNPLHLEQYSNGFTGAVDFEELDKHLYYSKIHPEGIPYIYRKQYDFKRDDSWGISLSYNTYKNLDRNSKYVVDIDVDLSKGNAAIYDLCLPGERKETIFFAAHTCHPAQVNDGIGCIALLIELFKWIKQFKKQRYTYRMILGPEYLAAAIFLAKAKNIENLSYGFFLDMMLHEGPMGYSISYQGDTLVDFVTEQYVKKHCEGYKQYPYRGLWGNDEMFYDGPDFEIPMIGLGRSKFKEYHLHKDDCKIIHEKSLQESMNLLKDFVLALENDRVIQRNYKGPLYQSRYDLYIDPKKNPQGAQGLQNMQIMMNGQRSNLEIAKALHMDIETVEAFTEQLLKNNLAKEIGG